MYHPGAGAFRRAIALLMAVMLLINLIPMTALADISATINNTPEQNQAILDALRQLYGEELTSQAAQQELGDLGLLDGTGEIAITSTINVDGEQLTLDQVRQMVFSADADLDKLVSVDGTPITLGDLKLMIEIEDELQRIRDTYFGDVTLTPEQQAALDSLRAQIESEGISISAEGMPGLVFPSGVDHSIYAEVTPAVEYAQPTGNPIDVIVTLKDSTGSQLTAVPNYDISISYRFVDGSAKADINYLATDGTLTFTANSDLTAQHISFSILQDDGHWEGQKSFLIQYYNPVNVLLQGKRAAETLVKINSDWVWPAISQPFFQHSMPWSFTVIDKPVPTQLADYGDFYTDIEARVSLYDYAGAASFSPQIFWGDIGKIWAGMPGPDDVAYQFPWFTPTSPMRLQTQDFLLIRPFDPFLYDRMLQTGTVGVDIRLTNWLESDCVARFSISMRFLDRRLPAVQAVSIPAGDVFEYGQSVPITVEFSEPVQPATAKLIVNNQELSAVESTSRGVYLVTFLYPVKLVDGTIINITSADTGFDLSNNARRNIELTESATGVMKGVNKADAFVNPSVIAGVQDGQMQGAVSLGLSDNPLLTAWVVSEAAANYDPALAKYRVPSIYASVDGGASRIDLYADNADAPTKLVGSFTPEFNTSGVVEERVLEFYLDPDLGSTSNHQLLIGTYDIYSVAPVVYLAETDLELTYSGFPEDNTIFAEDGDLIRLGYFVTNPDATWTRPQDLVWTSSDTSVCTISNTGVISPTGKPGLVSFTLTALNGGFAGKAVSVSSTPLTVKAGLTPFLNIPVGANVITMKEGNAAEVRWISNLIAKNYELAAETEFTVELFAADYSAGELRWDYSTPLYSQVAVGNQANQLASHAIPASYLTTISQFGRYSYVVRVSSPDPMSGITLSALAYISVLSQPAMVQLEPLPSYFITDSTSLVSVRWNLQHFDTVNGGEFKLTVTDNADSTVIYQQNETVSTGGGYQLAIPPVKNGFKDIYTIAVQAKNSADSTWSYDSFVLHVYSDAAMQLWIDGAIAGTQHSMSNLSKISEMSSAEILALQRDIYLRNVISIDYGDHAWGQISDQIKWRSSDSDIASINYRQGSLYENIENFSYISYRPATEFVLSGLNDGTVRISATHAATGKQQAVDVTVETLKDKLYLFQVYPRTVTRLNYTNGNGQQCSVQTDDTGALALYEPAGIRSDVHLQSLFNDREYWGTIYNDRLVSSEKDSTKLELYPENNFRLREVATVELYFKRPDGTPYQGEVTLRGGVYKNDQYCLDALLNGMDGKADQLLSIGADGRFTVKMDSTQFWVEENNEVLTMRDKLQFVLEVRFAANAYFPQLLMLDGNLNAYEVVSVGETAVRLENAKPDDQEKPFIARQHVEYPGTKPIDVRGFTENLGLGDKWERLTLRSLLLWWDSDDAALVPAQHRVSLQDQYGTVLPNQSSHTYSYPFSSMLVTEHTFQFDQAFLGEWMEPKTSRGLSASIINGEGVLCKQQSLPWRIVNMLGVEDVTESENLVFALQAAGGASAANANALNLNDSFIGKGLQFLQGNGIESELFSMVVRPTIDPAVFRGLIMLNLGNMANDNATGVYADDNINSDLDYTPSAMDMQKMLKGSYLDSQQKKYDYNKSHTRSQRSRDISYAIGGYMECEIRYDFDDEEWDVLILNGGFNAGGGVSYSWNYNAWAGPVPVTAQLSVGGTAEVTFRAAVQRGPKIEAEYGEDAVNDYLTTLRLYAYIRVFGGVGFDYTVVALKVGLFGQVSVDAQFAFLNQPYISSEARTGQYLTVNGKVGIEFVAKYLFVSYEKVLASLPFKIYERAYGEWNAIQTLWKEIGQGSGAVPLPKERAMLVGSQSVVYPLAERAILEQRDYLGQFDRTWVAPGRFSLLALDPVSGVKDLQTNAYPYSHPVLSDDGQLMVYISDSNSTDVEDTEVCWTRLSGSSYPDGTPIEVKPAGYGDSQLKLSGTAEFAVATWVRQTAGLQKEAGEAVTYSDVALMSNSTEIMVAVYDGSSWTTTQLTNNASPDLAPVVATNGVRTLVAWRSVYPADAVDPLNFSTQDSIVYRIYQDGVWSAPNTLYNGTSGAVKGMEAAMLADGTAAVTYTIDTLNSEFAVSDGESINSGLEAVYAIVGIDGQVLKNVRLTNDSYLDENPQITTVSFADGNEWFVLGWYSVHDADGVKVNDIRLAAFDRVGALHTDFIDSISSVNEYASVYISPNFRFAKNAKNITDLAILWSEPADSGGITDSSTLADKDLLKAVKFMSDNGRIFITSALNVAEMPDFTLINHFDAYVTGENNVKAVILGTSYDNGYEPTGLLVESAGVVAPLLTAIPQSGLYTAASTFENAIEVRSLGVDYQAVIRGMRIPVQFTLFNSGIEPITGITLRVGENEQEFSGLYLLPNGSITLTVYYDIPGDRVINPDYSITASFGEDASLVTLTDKLYLAIPDVGISKLDNLQEQDGERLLQVTLYNLSDVQLSGSDRIVKIGLYGDADMTAEVISPLVVSSAADLALIDAGAFTRQVTFDIQEYLGIGQEIPAGGVRIYARAWIEEPLPDLPGETGEIMEYYQGNNARSILFESLLLRNDGAPVTISTEQTNAGGYTTAVVTVRNNSLVNVSSGNLIVRLMDSRGNELETLQCYDPEAVNQGLIELGPEGVATREFTFSQQGDRVSVTYSNAIITDNTNANLAALTLSEIPFKFVAGVTEYSINVRELRSTTVSAVTEDPSATLQINGRDGGLTNVRLAAGRNTVQIAVTAADGVTVQKYMVTVYNYVPGSEPVIWPTVIQNPGGRVAYSSGGLVTVTPDQGYCVKDLLINGKSVGAVTSYIIPAGTEAYRIEALFGPATGLITIKQNNGGTVIVSEDKDSLSVTIAPDEGYRILDVLVDGVSVGAVSSYAFEPPATAHELEVIFAPIVGTVTVSHNAGGTVRVSEDGLNVSITPNNGYRIKDVLVDGESVGAVRSYLFTEPGQAHTVQVTFEPVGDILTGFTDVANHWARGAIAFAVERGLLVGTSANNFSPNTPITRAMLVTVLMRLHGGRPETQAQFSDVTAGAWYAGSIAWAVENGIAGSVGNNAFAPNRPATREELAQIVINYCRFAGIELPQAEVIAFSDISSVSPGSRAAVTDMQQAGLMGGRPGNLFDPQGTLTRAEFAAVLYRLLTSILNQ